MRQVRSPILSPLRADHDLSPRSTTLERKLNTDLLCAMQRAQIVRGVTAGTIPAAATTGMLWGYGLRLGAPARVFATIGAIVLHASGERTSGLLYVVVGVLAHVVAMLSFGGVYASLIGEDSKHGAAWSIAIAAAAIAAVFVSARTFAGSITLVLTPGNLIAVGVVIAIALPIGMRFAPYRV
jgi:hypothetical protein